jgi:hypothetical protein
MIELLAAIVLTWTAPIDRENGVPLVEGEIDSYEMYRDGEHYATVDGSVLELDVSDDGEYTVRAVDSDFQISEHSNVVSVQHKGKIGAPGQLRKRRRHE